MTITPLIDYFNRIVSLTPAEEEMIREKITYRRYLKDQYLVQQGDVCKHINFIVKGCVKLFYASPDGLEHILMFAIEDWWASDMGSFITQTPADYNVQCIEKTELLQLNYTDLEELYIKIPKLERCFRKITERSLVASQKRIIRNFSKTAKERYLFFKENFPAIEARIPQYMLASYLGITKEFLSRIKSQIAKGDKS
ncbi:CRP-like cAMP-binding protein [Tenacibaculum skagerrakense]|uniref:CRP-like cAMP-binding protein n=1 Tax=Tenacibaculum skagerrakense TaxID=186571 RepID=A0A4R2P3H9_9FLAO|nr:Crp/Fnr family transcriptional regulator [Tenacibaculum skagerrakense]TCP28574.1 CRP-like cAMP-binding protein [Tenacibaculum skagerrakense]